MYEELHCLDRPWRKEKSAPLSSKRDVAMMRHVVRNSVGMRVMYIDSLRSSTILRILQIVVGKDKQSLMQDVGRQEHEACRGGVMRDNLKMLLHEYSGSSGRQVSRKGTVPTHCRKEPTPTSYGIQ